MSKLIGSNYSKYPEPPAVKIVVVGPSGVGKTSISNRFVKDEFSGRVTATMGAAFSEKIFEYGNDKSIRMQIWDTAGQEKYRSIAKIYYQDAKIAILVYDVTNKSSFESMQAWADEVRSTAPKGVVLAIVGNKIDLLGDVASEYTDPAKFQKARDYAMSLGAVFKTVSAKNSKGVRELFTQLALEVADKIQEIETKPRRLEVPSNKKRGRDGCCS